MFLRPFLKYFRPFLWRIAIAIGCMVVVGMLSTVPLAVGRLALNVLAELIPASQQQIDREDEIGTSGILADAVAPGAAGQISAATGAKKAEGPPVLGLDRQTTASAGSDKLAASADRVLAETIGKPYTRPRDWFVHEKARLDDWYELHKETEPMRVLVALALVLVALTALKGLMEFISKYQLAHTFFFSNLRIREDIYFNILRQDYNYFNRNSAGYLHSRINSDAKAVGDILESLLSDGIQQPITVLCMFGFLLYLEAQLTLLVVLILPVIGGLLYYFAKVLRKNTRRQKRESDQLSSGLTESLNNIRLVKAFGTEDYEAEKFHGLSMALFRSIMARRVAKFGSSPLMELLGTVMAGGVMLLGGWLLYSDRMKFADLIIYLATLTRFYRPIRSLAVMNTKYQVARVSAERMHEMLQLTPEVREVANPRPFTRLERGIEFDNVGFSYADKRILKGITLSVAAGHSIAFAGPSGAGKTTVVNMIARLFDPNEGRILIDGIDLRELSLGDWRQHLAIVTQDTFLFDDTIEHNIAYGYKQVDRERLEAAARAANAHEFIMSLDGGRGYQTRVGPGGTRLSGGQRQRLAIARALYRDPQILILDEATSALDAQSQALVQEALTRLMVGRTTFIVAHRISTIRNVDCIYVLEHGEIVEAGTHEELLRRNGLYATLASQGDAASPTAPLVELTEP